MLTIPSTLGAVLVGSLLSIFLSGVVAMQTLLYASVYTKDRVGLKVMVCGVWLLDFLHTVFICVADWDYLITHWSSTSIEDWIPWAVAATVALTAIMTFVVQCFFAYRVHTVSRHKLYISAPLAGFALARLVAALVSTAMMIHYKSYAVFRVHIGWVFTLGLALSATLDILVALSLCYYLQTNRSGFSSLDSIINTLTFYTIQNGSLTFITTLVALICWVSLRNLIFLALHFIITKLYANAFLSTLNARRGLRLQQSSAEQDPSLPRAFTTIDHSRALDRGRTQSHIYPTTESIPMTAKVQINVERNIQVESDFEQESEPSKVSL